MRSFARTAFRRCQSGFVTGLLAALVLSGADAAASSARFTLPELIEHSEVIALGTLVGFERAPDPHGSGAVRVGVIRIGRLLRGPAGLDRVRLMLPQPGEPVAGATIDYRDGNSGLWFLRRLDGSNQLFAADHPQRFVPPDSAHRMIKAVKMELNRQLAPARHGSLACPPERIHL